MAVKELLVLVLIIKLEAMVVLVLLYLNIKSNHDATL